MIEPKIRFKGFEGEEWKECKLGEICTINRGVRVTKKDLNPNNLYPVFQNTNYPLGYYNKYNVKANNPFVIIGGSAGLVGFSTENFWAADDCAYFGDNNNLDKYFLYNTLSYHISEIKKNVRGSSVPRLDRSSLLEMEVKRPMLPEQKVIASYFTSLDKQITASTSRLASLKQMKAASLQSMFPQEGETIPKIRFKGFEGEWKINTISDVLHVNSGRDYKHLETGNIPVYGTGGYMLSVNDSLCDSDAIGIGRKGTINKPQYLKGPFWTVDTLFFLTTKKGEDLSFLFSLSQTINWKKYDESTGVPSLSKNNIEQIEIYIPNLAEQQAIANYFTSLDKQIALETQRLEKLKQIKSACLDKMFV